VTRFFARPLGTFFFSCFSTCGAHAALADDVLDRGAGIGWWWRRGGEAVFVGRVARAFSAALEDGFLSYLGSLRLDLTGTRERTVNLTHVGV
jgi:hypothetical protein